MTSTMDSSSSYLVDKARSVSIPAGQTPIVTFRQTHEQKLGKPYSVCVGNNSLAFFSTYTVGHCIAEVCVSLIKLLITLGLH